ncbi:type ISP restriction/modification enzyme [Staphylococcus sp. 17KM0847]|uniref:type ISP restriction/modification enzyme n=1 Tax=Staphylococcus sp. 17KM0847 TaxID=2583989 RepID=UPI0035B5AA4A
MMLKITSIYMRNYMFLIKNDVFKYIYGVLHSPVYREKYSTNLQLVKSLLNYI